MQPAEQRFAMKLSIIVPNYNYGDYVATAIDSALALDWPDKEIIVADDGSTDNSQDIIRSYGEQIISLFLSNGGQNSACNAGFVHSTGDIIIFLDADDVLFPSVADILRSVWSDGISKLQWSLVVTDQDLKPTGRCYPSYRTTPSPEWVRSVLARTGHYPFSIGGAWSRDFLRQVFPVPMREGIHRGGANGDCTLPVIDHYLSKLAPFFGDVVCLSHDEPQGAYRMHIRNNHCESFLRYAQSSMEPFECARLVNKLLDDLKIVHQTIDMELDENTMKRQLVCQRLRLHPRRCLTNSAVLWKYWRSVRLSDASVGSKIKWLIWSIIVITAPQPVSLWAIRQRKQSP